MLGRELEGERTHQVETEQAEDLSHLLRRHQTEARMQVQVQQTPCSSIVHCQVLPRRECQPELLLPNALSTSQLMRPPLLLTLYLSQFNTKHDVHILLTI